MKKTFKFKMGDIVRYQFSSLSEDDDLRERDLPCFLILSNGRRGYYNGSVELYDYIDIQKLDCSGVSS